MIRAGDVRRWIPKYHQNGGVYVDREHPWFGDIVKVLEVEENAAGRMCRIRPAQTPKVNNPHAFEFWTEEEDLEQID